MEAMITVIMSGSEQDATVCFKTPYGESWGHWVGVPPELHETYDIEFAIGEAFIWGETAIVTQDRRALLKQDQGRVLIQGQLEVTYPNDLAVLRLGEATIAVTIHGEAPNPGTFVRLYTASLSLYDSGVWSSNEQDRSEPKIVVNAGGGDGATVPSLVRRLR